MKARTLEELELIKLPNTEFYLSDYLHGRCHLFAQALHEELGYEIEFFWDEEAWFNEGEYIGIALVHAYCILPKGKPFRGKYVDVRGVVTKKMIEDEFDWNVPKYEKISIEQLKTLITNNVLFEGEKNEVKELRRYIRENIQFYS
jgi:hypothetical protein